MEHLIPNWILQTVQTLGLPGLIFVIWWWDGKKAVEREESRRTELAAVLAQYREDITAIRSLYESNVRLVDDYATAFKRLDTIYTETISVISLNTQAQTKLVEKIKGNQFCPLVREKGGAS
jgi:uncharacterized protein YegL